MLIAVLAIAIIGVAVYDLAFVLPQKSPITTSFLNEPVVDVIIPSLFNNGANAPLNVSTGEHATLVVQIYPTVRLDALMKFQVDSSPLGGNNRSISATFDPSTLDIAAGSSGNTTMNIYVSKNATNGLYYSSVSAVNLENSSELWGNVVQIDVAL